MFLGQPRRCICTNASRGLSATAEFLVIVSRGKMLFAVLEFMIVALTVSFNLIRFLTFILY